MNGTNRINRAQGWPQDTLLQAILGKALRLLMLIVVDALTVAALTRFIADGVWFLALAVGVIVLGLNVVVLVDKLYPLRWLAPGLALLVLMVIAPMVYTVYVAFTKYNANHLLTEQQAVHALELETFLNENAVIYQWVAYRSPSGDYALWLKAPDGTGLLALPGKPVQPAAPGTSAVGPLDQDGFPQSIQGYERLSRIDVVKNLTEVSKLEFGQPPALYKIKSLDQAAQYQQKYTYDSATDTLTDHETGITYQPVEGTFTSKDGQTISPAFQAPTGLANFQRLFENPAIREPVVQIFLWTVAFALIVVLVQFVLGLIMALALNDADIPRSVAKAIRSILLLPFVIPTYLSILVWGAMLNPNIGVITGLLHTLFGWPPNWVLDPWGARLSTLLVTFWLGFPYFLLVNSGALQAISAEVMEAADVDGASSWQKFWNITFPLLLTTVSPLMVLAFAFNFNNFTVIYLLTGGGPPMPNVQTPAGFTDLLITYTYKLSFTFGQGSDFGFASVISMMIFLILVPVVYSQFRYYKVWSEEGTNA